MLIGGHCVKTWSLSQGPISMSSAEAEYYAMVEAATRAIGIQTVANETGMDFEIGFLQIPVQPSRSLADGGLVASGTFR